MPDKIPAKTASEDVPEVPKIRVLDLGDGFTLGVSADALDDLELVDDIRALDAEEDDAVMRIPQTIRRLVGKEQYRKVLDHLRDPQSGRVSLKQGAELIGRIMEALNPNS